MNQIDLTTKPVVLVDFERFKQLIEIEAKYVNLSDNTSAQQPLNSVEQDLTQGSSAKQALDEAISKTFPKFIHNDKEYALMAHSRIKVSGILDKFLAHPKLGPAIKTAITKEEAGQLGERWLPVTIYKTLYENVDGEIWVRMEEEFQAKFKPV